MSKYKHQQADGWKEEIKQTVTLWFDNWYPMWFKEVTFTSEKAENKFREAVIGFTYGVAIDRLEQFLDEQLSKKEEEVIRYRRIHGATDWLRNVYGLDDDDILTAGEVEELLDTYINEEMNELKTQTKK